MFVYMYLCKYVCVSRYVFKCMYVHMHMHIRMHVDRYGYDCLYMCKGDMCQCLLILMN